MVMGSIRHLRRALLSCLLILATLARTVAADGPPLGARAAGLYVGVADGYMFGRVPFTFSIDQVSRKSDPEALRGMIERLHANGKRSILDIFLYEKADEQAQPATAYMAWLDALLAKLPLAKVYAITLSEENIYWNGHQEMLTELYGLVKAKYPTLAVYQWYSPGAGAPGFGWPLLPADGWLIDEYCRPRQAFANLVKKYVVLDKPLIHIAWAAPGWKEFSTWDQVWDDQLEICRSYRVPIAFFCWWPPDSTPPPPGNQSLWSWSAPPGSEHHRVWNEVVLAYVQRLQQGLRDTLDVETSAGRVIPVAGDEQGQFRYREDFRTAPQFIDDADIEGFTALRWTGTRLELKPERTAVLTYRLESPFALHDVQAELICAAPEASVVLSLAAAGKTWVAQRNAGPRVAAVLPEVPDGRGFQVRVELSSQAGKPVAIEGLAVSAKVDPPAVPQVVLSPAADGTVAFADDFRSQLYLHTGRLTNPAEVRWAPGTLRMFGKQGYVNAATVDYHFVCATPLRELVATLTGAAGKADFGASLALSVSLDGTTFQPAASSDGEGKPAFRGDLVVRPEVGEAGAKELWVRLTLRNTCGVATQVPSPSVTRLTLAGKVAR
jgi:hypothetical protein